MNQTEKTTEKKEKRKKGGFFSVFLLLIFLLSSGACLYLIYGEICKELGIREMETDLQAYVTSQPSTTAPEPDAGQEPDSVSEEPDIEPSYLFDWEGLSAQSDYVIGWIQIPGIKRISYPIVQNPDDNQFFLTHDWTGASQSAGAIFLNRYNASDFSDMNSIIYGHRMKAGSMFGSLKQYGDQKFLDEHPYFYIYTPDGAKRTYEIICYSSVTDGSDAYLMHFESPNERMAYYDMMIYNAISKRDIELNRFDTTIILSTCNTTGYYDRLAVLGKLVAIDLNGQIAE